MRQLILSPYTADDEWSGEALLLESSVLDSPENCDRILRSIADNTFIVIQDLVSPTITRFIPLEDEKIRIGFQTCFAERSKKAAELGITEFSLSFDLERAAEDAEFCDALKVVLQSVAGILSQFRMRLLLTAHLPSDGAADGAWLAQFRQDLLLPNVGFLLELHDNDEAIIEPLRFYSDRIVKREHRADVTL